MSAQTQAKEVTALPTARAGRASTEATIANAGTLAEAMAQAFGEIEAATKSATNPAFKQGGKVSKYADITAVIEAIKPALINHGLFFTQHPHPSEDGVCVETVLHHSGGESLSLGSLFVPANKRDAQGFGSALTYARRYALVTAFGVPVEDDDGNAAARSFVRTEPTDYTPAEPIAGETESAEYKFPEGPARNITELKTMARSLWREIEGCGDDSELDPLLDTADSKALLKQLAALENPAHLEIWHGDGKDNPGISGLIVRKQTEFAQRAPNILQAG